MQYKKTFLFLSLIILSMGLRGQEPDSLRISLLTCAAGEDVYSIFGHSAIRVQNFTSNQDLVYNYGTFDFQEPGFYQNFLKGKLKYKLAVHSYDSFIRAYKYQRRSVIAQEFFLSREQKSKTNNFLINNYHPDNRYYLYDFFYDNCSTRIRDVFDIHIGLSLISPPKENRGLTFRQGLDNYNYTKPWIDFGMDLIVGMPADKVMTFRQEMYLPDYLSENLAQYYIIDGKETSPLLSASKEVLTFDHLAKRSLPWPLILFVGIFILLLLYQLFFRSQRADQLIDLFLFSALSIGGFIIAFMWFGTDHLATKNNLNLLWMHPLYLSVIYVLIKKKNVLFLYVLILSIVMLLMVGWNWLPQQLHRAVFPILGIIGLRCLNRVRIAREDIKRS